MFLVWLADLSRIARLADEADCPTEGFKYQEALFLGIIDATLAAQNAAVAAESLGLGTCFVGGVRNGMTAISEYLELPHNTFPVVGLTVGWPSDADTASTKPRLSLAGLAFDEKYDVNAADHALPTLNQESAEYRASQRQPPLIWTEDAVTKWATPAWISTRAGNRDLLINRGFADQ